MFFRYVFLILIKWAWFTIQLKSLNLSASLSFEIQLNCFEMPRNFEINSPSRKWKVNVFEKMQAFYILSGVIKRQWTNFESALAESTLASPQTHLRTFTHQPQALLKRHFASNFSSLSETHFSGDTFLQPHKEHLPRSMRWKNQRKKGGATDHLMPERKVRKRSWFILIVLCVLIWTRLTFLREKDL